MKKFVLAHYGYETPTPEIMDAWGTWFSSFGDRIVENVGPFGTGVEISRHRHQGAAAERGSSDRLLYHRSGKS